MGSRLKSIQDYEKMFLDAAHINYLIYYLHEPKHGTIVFYKGFDKSAASFADLGAYGSTILGTLENDRNLLYCQERIAQIELTTYIRNMPPRYRDLIKPQMVKF